jgi:hypothetical protein
MAALTTRAIVARGHVIGAHQLMPSNQRARVAGIPPQLRRVSSWILGISRMHDVSSRAAEAAEQARLSSTQLSPLLFVVIGTLLGLPC